MINWAKYIRKDFENSLEKWVFKSRKVWLDIDFVFYFGAISNWKALKKEKLFKLDIIAKWSNLKRKFWHKTRQVSFYCSLFTRNFQNKLFYTLEILSFLLCYTLAPVTIKPKQRKAIPKHCGMRVSVSMSKLVTWPNRRLVLRTLKRSSPAK